MIPSPLLSYITSTQRGSSLLGAGGLTAANCMQACDTTAPKHSFDDKKVKDDKDKKDKD